jgi:hypothetical protein
MFKLHIFGYHSWYGGRSVEGGINPNFGFHCSKCCKSWYPFKSGFKVKLQEEAGLRPADFFTKPGMVFMGRMTIDELLQNLNKS